MIAKDWIIDAVEQIAGDPECCDISSSSASKMQEIIAAHCPFKPDVAYMPVPRCETCTHWHKNTMRKTGECALTEWDDIDDHAHPESLAKANAGGHEPGSAALETAADFGCVQWKAK